MSDSGSIFTGQIHVIQLSNVKAFLVECTGGSVLVDTGSSDEDAKKILEKLKEIGKDPTSVRVCIITHHHNRHVGGLRTLKKVCKFSVFAHKNDAGKIFAKTNTPVDRELSGGEIIPFCGGIHVIYTPGHTFGTIVLYLPAFKALIAGDTLMGARGRLLLPPPESCEDPRFHLESIRKLESLDFDIVFVSHGDDILEQGKIKLLKLLESLKK